MPTTQQVIAAGVRIARATKYGFLTTLGEAPRTRVVQHLEVTDDMVVTFSTDPASRKAGALAAYPEVTYGMFDSETLAAVTVYGSAMFDEDLDRRFHLWNEDLGFFFPGPADDSFVLVTIQPQRLEVWSIFDDLMPPPTGLSSATIERSDDGWSEPFGTYPASKGE